MKPVLHAFRGGLNTPLAFMSDWLGKLSVFFAAPAREVRSQRMCPFCGLITPRSKRFCLECGKSFGEIQLEQQVQDRNE